MKQYSQVGISQVAARAKLDRSIVERIFDVITAFLEEGTSIKVPEFGTFIPKRRGERIVRSPMVRGVPVKVPPGRVVKFKMAPSLRRAWYDRINVANEGEVEGDGG